MSLDSEKKSFLLPPPSLPQAAANSKPGPCCRRSAAGCHNPPPPCRSSARGCASFPKETHWEDVNISMTTLSPRQPAHTHHPTANARGNSFLQLLFSTTLLTAVRKETTEPSMYQTLRGKTSSDQCTEKRLYESGHWGHGASFKAWPSFRAMFLDKTSMLEKHRQIHCTYLLSCRPPLPRSP